MYISDMEKEFSLKSLFTPLTNVKAVHFLLLIGFLVFANCLFNNFVWDDNSYIINYFSYQKLSLLGLFGSNLYNATSQYRPIPAMYFYSLYSMFGNIPFFYHLIQILLHSIATILLFFLLKKFFKPILSFFLSLIFLIHPIQVESVSFIAACGNILFFLFGITAFHLSYIYKKNSFLIPLLIFFLLLSLLSKETGILFFLIILLYAFIYKKQNLFTLFSSGIIVLILYSFIRFFIGKIYFKKMLLIPIGDLTFSQRLINIPQIIFYYLKTFFYPDKLAISQQWIVKKMDFVHFFYPLIADLLFFSFWIILCLVLYKKNKKLFQTLLFFFLWFLSGLFIHLQIFPLDMTVADRWFYFPIVGLIGMIGVLLLIIQKKVNQKILLFIFSIIVLMFSLRTIIRNINWKDDITLASHDVNVFENSFDLENNLSYAYIKTGECNKAKLHAEKSIKIYPTFDNYINLGVSNYCLNNFKEAKKAYQNALKIADASSAYVRLANLALTYGDAKENINYLKHTALKKFPRNSILWQDLAILEYKQGNIQNAKDEIKNALIYDPTGNVLPLYKIIMNNEHLNGIEIRFGKEKNI